LGDWLTPPGVVIKVSLCGQPVNPKAGRVQMGSTPACDRVKSRIFSDLDAANRLDETVSNEPDLRHFPIDF
jgi:hypothetical protein